MSVVLSRVPVAIAALAVVLGSWEAPIAGAEVRLKDVITLQGAAPAPLVGYGLVVGLNKTGDRRQTQFSTQSLANMLTRFGVIVPADQMKVENVAAVLVTAELSPFQRAGARLDVLASSIGDARSLQGGTLLPTPLRGPAGDIAALAQGPLSLGGFGGGGAGASVQVNHLTVGRIPSGAIVQTVAPVAMPQSSTITFALRDPDFVTATRVATAINGYLGGSPARAIDAGSVALAVPSAFRDSLPDLLAQIESLPVETDVVARVVINERTGTVVVGGNVQLSAAAVAHGNLSVRISTTLEASQPLPYSRGQTVLVPNQQVDVQEGNAKLIAMPEGVTLDAVTSALNALGASPRDIIAIMQALKAAGALRADLVIL
ncbi:MAG TPA: flagellar basal body P-ring protein FlgI [Vicinamibacterales bacterium]|nr:flagellar basal body P-ring protein FlgI [Vicinamibacterales bacterium]